MISAMLICAASLMLSVALAALLVAPVLAGALQFACEDLQPEAQAAARQATRAARWVAGQVARLVDAASWQARLVDARLQTVNAAPGVAVCSAGPVAWCTTSTVTLPAYYKKRTWAEHGAPRYHTLRDWRRSLNPQAV